MIETINEKRRRIRKEAESIFRIVRHKDVIWLCDEIQYWKVEAKKARHALSTANKEIEKLKGELDTWRGRHLKG